MATLYIADGHVKIGIGPINVGLTGSLGPAKLACHAEQLGFESVWTYEHVVVPVDYSSRYPYSRTGKMPVDPETAFVDPLITLAHVAGVTETIRLATGICILPQANPLILAKQIASLDHLSGGRFLFGVGTGWLREEFEALGVPFARRGARTDEYLRGLRAVWSGDVVEVEGEFLSWSGFKSFPLPLSRPHPPVIIGGTSDRAIRRVLEQGDGWFMPNRHIRHLGELVTRLGEVAETLGERDPATVELTGMWNFEREPDAVPAYADLGVSRLVLQLHSIGDDLVEGLARVAAHLGLEASGKG